MTETVPHAWFRPRLAALIAEAQQAGITPDQSVAVITDLVNGPLAAATPVVADEDWNRDIGEPESAVGGAAGTAPDQSTGQAVPNPLDHLGIRGI